MWNVCNEIKESFQFLQARLMWEKESSSYEINLAAICECMQFTKMNVSIMTMTELNITSPTIYYEDQGSN